MSSSPSTNTSQTIRRAILIMKALKGHSLDGVSNNELAVALQESPANISRTLNTLVNEGMVQRLPTGRYAPVCTFFISPSLFPTRWLLARPA